MAYLATAAVLLALVGAAPTTEATTILNAVNHERADQGLASLRIDPRLTQAAQFHAQDMADHDFFSHEGSNGSRVDARVQAVGYRYRLVAENIAAGQTSPSDVVDGWMHSEGHRQNILRPTVRDMGVGHVILTDDPGRIEYHHYWVLVLGRSAD